VGQRKKKVRPGRTSGVVGPTDQPACLALRRPNGCLKNDDDDVDSCLSRGRRRQRRFPGAAPHHGAAGS